MCCANLPGGITETDEAVTDFNGQVKIELNEVNG